MFDAKAVTDVGSVKFCCKMLTYFSPVNIPSINCRLPVPADEKQPHTKTAPSPCFTVGVIRECLKLSPTFLHASCLLLFERSSNFDSSVNITFFQKSIGLFVYYLANANRLWAWGLLISGRFLDTRPWYPASFILMRNCVSSMGRCNSDFNCFDKILRFLNTSLNIMRSCRTVVFLGCSDLGRFPAVPLVSNRFTTFLTHSADTLKSAVIFLNGSPFKRLLNIPDRSAGVHGFLASYNNISFYVWKY